MDRERERSPRRDYRDEPPAREADRPEDSHSRGGGEDRGGSVKGSGRFGHAAPQESNVLGVFGLSIRTRERDLEDEFFKSGDVKKVVVVYDQRSQRSRGFGFVTMGSVEDAARAIKDLNGYELHGRRIRVDFSLTERPHDPTPGQYMGVIDDRDRDRDSRPFRDSRGPPPPRYDDRRRDDYRRDDRYDRRDDRYDDRRDRDRDRPRYSDRDYDSRDRRPRDESPRPRRRSPSPRPRRDRSLSPDRRPPPKDEY